MVGKFKLQKPANATKQGFFPSLQSQLLNIYQHITGHNLDVKIIRGDLSFLT